MPILLISRINFKKIADFSAKVKINFTNQNEIGHLFTFAVSKAFPEHVNPGKVCGTV